MKKIRLQLDALAVESFEINGGVKGHDDTFIVASNESGCGPCPTQEKTCPDTCYDTCRATCRSQCTGDLCCTM